MRYYENRVTTDNVTSYVVNANISSGEKIPRTIDISIDEKKYTIDNYFPGLEIDYKTGGATVRPEYKDMITISTERDSTKNGDDIIVYYKSKKPKVYWYSEKKLNLQMISSESKNYICSCSEREAIQKGLYHSKIEK